MGIVLTKRILKALTLPTFNDLGPFLLIGTTKNPTRHVLRLNHKYTEAGYQEMVNLRCATSNTQDDIRQNMVSFFV